MTKLTVHGHMGTFDLSIAIQLIFWSNPKTLLFRNLFTAKRVKSKDFNLKGKPILIL